MKQDQSAKPSLSIWIGERLHYVLLFVTFGINTIDYLWWREINEHGFKAFLGALLVFGMRNILLLIIRNNQTVNPISDLIEKHPQSLIVNGIFIILALSGIVGHSYMTLP